MLKSLGSDDLHHVLQVKVSTGLMRYYDAHFPTDSVTPDWNDYSAAINTNLLTFRRVFKIKSHIKNRLRFTSHMT